MKVRPASSLPAQTHIHWKVPDASDRIRTPTMDFPAHVPRRPGQCYGGLWTATPNAYGSTACIDMQAINQLRNPRPTVPLFLWHLTPDPDATLAVIEGASDYRELCGEFPYERGGIDVAALLHEVDGLHVTDTAALAARAAPDIHSEHDLNLGLWVYQSIHWRRFAFVACEPLSIDTACYPLPAFDVTYFPVVLAMGHVPADPTMRAAIRADLETRNRDALDAVRPVMDWLKQRRTQDARAGPSVAAD